MKELETTVLPDLSALMTLRSLVPFSLPVGFSGRASLVGQVGHDAAGDIIAAIWKAALELK